MKRIWLKALVVFVAATASGQYLDESFDVMPFGVISSQPGWEASFSSSMPFIFSGYVTNILPRSGDRAVLLPETLPPFTMGSRAACTGFVTTAAAGRGAVLRASVWIYRENLNQRLTVRFERDSRGQIMLVTDPATGNIILTNAVSGTGWDTFHKWVTNAYAQLVIHFDVARNEVSLDYNGEVISDWVPIGGPATNYFNRFSVFRDAASNSTGLVLLDDMCVEAFPTNTYAWFRLGDTGTNYVDEALGSFFVAKTDVPGNGTEAPFDTMLLDTWRDVPNGAALRWFMVTNTWVARPVAMTNWTLEAIVKLGPEMRNRNFLDWGHYLGVTNSWINWMVYVQSTQLKLAATLRDRVTTFGDDFYPAMGTYPTDGAWHHVALVKSGAVLRSYLDYEKIAESSLSLHSTGAYSFAINAQLVIGQSLGEGNFAGSQDCMDELRISSVVLPPQEFLRPSHTVMKGIQEISPGVMQVTFSGPLGVTHAIPFTSNLVSQGWVSSPAAVVTSTGYISRLTFSGGPSNLFMRLSRQKR